MSHSRSFSVSLPHARGGVSVLPLHQRLFRSLPHARGGVSWPFASARLPISVFPTHVGVFLSPIPSVRLVYRLPHARGGVSVVDRRRGALASSSPRTWGCFHLRDVVDKRVGVFPTHVGVFPLHEIALDKAKSLPHARGGVSFFMENDLWNLKSSPRTWGCFCAAAARPMSQAVFPTHVGVFPGSCTSGRRTSRLPHARGGVSQTADATKRQKDVFPTHVGVFLHRSA